MKKRKRGRPIGFRLSEASKRAISDSKLGQRHTQATKEKISKSLILYFRHKHPLSEEIERRYCNDNFDSEEYNCEWMDAVRDEIDGFENVLTERALRNKQKMEITCGEYIEFFHHEVTPELLVLFKEHCILNGIDMDDAFNDL